MKKHFSWLIPIICVVLITPFTPQLDLAISSYFYNKGVNNSDHFVKNKLLDFFFDFGPLPAEIIAVLASLFLLLSYISPFWKPLRSACLLLVLVMVVAVGIITHAILKDHWGRPRPKQIIEFGGKQPFRPYYQPNFHAPEPSKSFPCGHCSMGFYFFSVALLGKRYRSKILYWLGMTLALSLGTIFGYMRIAQGGHFFSDVLVGALLIWLVSLVLDWLIFSLRDVNERVDKKTA